MRLTCLVFALIAFASLTLGTSYAAPSNQDRASQQSSSQTSENTLGDHPRDAKHAAPDDGGNPSDERRDHRHISDRIQQRSPATIKDRPKLPNIREHSPSRHAMNLHQPGSDKSSGAARGGFIQHETVNSVVPPRSPSVVRPSVPLLNNMRHRGPNPAVVGGSANAGRNAGAINGTRVHGKS